MHTTIIHTVQVLTTLTECETGNNVCMTINGGPTQHAYCHSQVNAFMNVARERFNILKKGSRQGYLADPQRTACSSIWDTPVSSIGVVRNATLQTSREKYLISASIVIDTGLHLLSQ